MVNSVQPKRNAGMRAVRGAKVNVGPSRMGHHRTELGQRQRPAALKSPPTIHTRAIPPMYGTSRATLAGTRKIPEPITQPTTTQNASTGPSTRGSVVEWRSAGSASSSRSPLHPPAGGSPVDRSRRSQIVALNVRLARGASGRGSLLGCLQRGSGPVDGPPRFPRSPSRAARPAALGLVFLDRLANGGKGPGTISRRHARGVDGMT